MTLEMQINEILGGLDNNFSNQDLVEAELVTLVREREKKARDMAYLSGYYAGVPKNKYRCDNCCHRP